MPKKNSESPQLILAEEHTRILLDEAGRMQTLYLNAAESIQTVFNFYLTFVTAIIGGVIFLLQTDADRLYIQLSLIALLLFAVLVSSVYISAMSARYAYAARYAHVLDELRQFILSQTNTSLPSLYEDFLKQPAEPTASRQAWYLWLIPSGTYQMFMSFISGAALALVVGLIGMLGSSNPALIILAGLFCFILTQIVLNLYSRLVITRFQQIAIARIYTGDSLALWAARQ